MFVCLITTSFLDYRYLHHLFIKIRNKKTYIDEIDQFSLVQFFLQVFYLQKWIILKNLLDFTVTNLLCYQIIYSKLYFP